jgi:hypothetical protein
MTFFIMSIFDHKKKRNVFNHTILSIIEEHEMSLLFYFLSI